MSSVNMQRGYFSFQKPLGTADTILLLKYKGSNKLSFSAKFAYKVITNT